MLGSLRVWDELDEHAAEWARRSRASAVERTERHGEHNISLRELSPVPNLWRIDWGRAINFKRSEGGRSSGVYFVMLPHKSELSAHYMRGMRISPWGMHLARCIWSGVSGVTYL